MQSDIGNPQDHRVRELLQLRLTLRDDLRFTPGFEAGQAFYLVEDAARTQFFRIGVAEYLLISMFDGSTTVGDALVRVAQADGDHVISETDASAICKWLIDSELAFTSESSSAGRLSDQAAERTTRRRLATWNPLCMKVPLAYPSGFFRRISPWAGVLFGPLAAFVALIVMAMAIYRLAVCWDAFAIASSQIFSPGRWIWLAVCWVALKVIHESAHGIVCRKYGGSVHEAGIIFVLFAPLAYVDLTSCWRFRSKWQRIHTAAAGMQAELMVATLAALVWSATGPGVINDLCFNVVIMASLTTLLFNANPLMRFDGYYILSDLLEIPNLYSQGQNYLKYVGRRYVLGEKLAPTLTWSWRDVVTRLYGVAAYIWRFIICASLVIAAASMFHGLGLILAAIAVGLWVAVPLVRLFCYVWIQDGLAGRRKKRLALAAVAVGCLTALLLQTPWPAATKAQAIVSYEPITFVRAASPGFVKDIHVRNGQRVREGDLLALLSNHELEAELKDLDWAIEQSQLKLRVFQQKDEMHFYQAELEQLTSLREKRDQKNAQVSLLQMRAPADGQVIARNLHIKNGTFLAEGDELMVIADESRKELQLAIEQSDFDRFESQLGSTVNVRMSGGKSMTSTLARVDPRATTRAPHDSMYAAYGGALENRSVANENDGEKFQALTPHFVGVIDLSESQSRQLRTGQRGMVWFGRGHQTIGSYLKRKIVGTYSDRGWVHAAI